MGGFELSTDNLYAAILVDSSEICTAIKPLKLPNLNLVLAQPHSRTTYRIMIIRNIGLPKVTARRKKMDQRILQIHLDCFENIVE